VYW
jgi:hypothetical protein